MVDNEFVFRVMRGALELPESTVLTPQSAFEEVPGWDSFGHMRIIAGLEDALNIELDIAEVVDQNTVEKLRDMVNKKIESNKG